MVRLNRSTIVDYHQLYCLSTLLVFPHIRHHFELKSQDLFALFVTLHSILADSCFLEIITVHKNITLVSIHYDETIVLSIIKKFEPSSVFFIFIDFHLSWVILSSWVWQSSRRHWRIVVREITIAINKPLTSIFILFIYERIHKCCTHADSTFAEDIGCSSTY